MASTTRRIASTSLSSKIIAHLVSRGHSQADIARMLGVSQGFISLVKSRERGLTLDHLERISFELDVPIGAFLLSVTEKAATAADPSGVRAAIVQAVKKADEVRDSIMRRPVSSAKH